MHSKSIIIFTTNKLSAASVNNHPELDPNTFSLLLVHSNNHIQFINSKHNTLQQKQQNRNNDVNKELLASNYHTIHPPAPSVPIIS